MNTSMVRYLLCRVLQIQTAFLALPAFVGLIYRESEGWSFAAVAVICLVIGTLGARKSPEDSMQKKDIWWLR